MDIRVQTYECPVAVVPAAIRFQWKEILLLPRAEFIARAHQKGLSCNIQVVIGGANGASVTVKAVSPRRDALIAEVVEMVLNTKRPIGAEFEFDPPAKREPGTGLGRVQVISGVFDKVANAGHRQSPFGIHEPILTWDNPNPRRHRRNPVEFRFPAVRRRKKRAYDMFPFYRSTTHGGNLEPYDPEIVLPVRANVQAI